MNKNPRVAVRAIISDNSGRVLILQRTNTIYSSGFWELPGGKVEYGETLEIALEQEVHEETGLEITDIRYFTYLDGIPENNKLPHFVTMIFTCIARGKVCLSEESSDFQWIGNKELDRFELAFKNGEVLKMFWNM